MIDQRFRLSNRALRFVLVVIALWVTIDLPRAHATIVQVSPQAKTFDLGALKVSVLRDGALAFPNDGTIFGVNAGPAAVAKVLRDAGAASNEIRLDISVLLVRMPGRLVLLDSGYGAAGHSVLPRSLALVGVSPDEVTDILITHAHPDHVGGLIDAQGRSAFPKATVRMSADEWVFMQRQADVRTEVPVIRAQVLTFEPGRPVLPGITALALPGHTPGHVGYEIVSQGQKLIDVGDIVHSAIISVAKPDWTLAWDSDQAEAVRTRRGELQRLEAAHELMFAPHFPFPGIGRIEPSGTGFKFLPELPHGK